MSWHLLLDNLPSHVLKCLPHHIFCTSAAGRYFVWVCFSCILSNQLIGFIFIRNSTATHWVSSCFTNVIVHGYTSWREKIYVYKAICPHGLKVCLLRKCVNLIEKRMLSGKQNNNVTNCPHIHSIQEFGSFNLSKKGLMDKGKLAHTLPSPFR